MTVSEEKKVLRSHLRSSLATFFAQEDGAALSLAASKRLLSLESYRTSDIVLAYVAHGNEASCQDVIFHALNSGKKVALPRVHEGTCEMDFYCLEESLPFGDQFQTGSFGISEPLSTLEKLDVSPGSLSGKKVFVVLPGLGFTKTGSRLGKGKGFYDRFVKRLEESRASLTLCGFCLSLQIVPSIPQNENDRTVNLVVTEKEIIPCA